MNQYFDNFPLITFDPAGMGQELIIAKDIMHRCRVRSLVKDQTTIYFPYAVKDGEQPWMIAQQYYGSAKRHWIVLLANDIINFYTDWCLSSEDLNAFIIAQCGSLAAAMQTIHHYEDEFGNEIDLTTFNSGVHVSETSVSMYDYWTAVNEAKRNIQLIAPRYADQIENELRDLLTIVKA